MKKIENILIISAFLITLSSIILCIVAKQPWFWQLTTILWIYVVFTKNKLINRYENLIQKMSKK